MCLGKVRLAKCAWQSAWQSAWRSAPGKVCLGKVRLVSAEGIWTRQPCTAASRPLIYQPWPFQHTKFFVFLFLLERPFSFTAWLTKLLLFECL